VAGNCGLVQKVSQVVTPSAPYLFVFIAGFAAGVYSMLQGVTADPAARRTTRLGMLTAPAIAGFAVVFGAVGYLCASRSSISYPVIFLIALAGASATIPASARVLAKLTHASSVEAIEPSLEGQLAVVSRQITRAEAGEVIFERDGRQFRNRAVHILGSNLEEGHEVVVERIENGTAYVEDWNAVEQRL